MVCHIFIQLLVKHVNEELMVISQYMLHQKGRDLTKAKKKDLLTKRYRHIYRPLGLELVKMKVQAVMSLKK